MKIKMTIQINDDSNQETVVTRLCKDKAEAHALIDHAFDFVEAEEASQT